VSQFSPLMNSLKSVSVYVQAKRQLTTHTLLMLLHLYENSQQIAKKVAGNRNKVKLSLKK